MKKQTNETFEIALIDYISRAFYDDNGCYNEEILIAQKITDWITVTQEELDALKTYSRYRIVYKPIPVDTKQEIQNALDEKTKADKIYAKRAAAAQKRLEAQRKRAAEKRKKKQAVTVKEKKELLKKLKKELGEE